MIELQGFISWLSAKHPTNTEIIEAGLREHFADALDGTQTLPVDYARVQRALEPAYWESLQDLYDEYSRDFPYIQTR